MTYYEPVPMTEDAAIDRLNTLCRGSVLYPHYGTPGLALPYVRTTAFRQNRATAMTLSRLLRPTPPWGSVLGGPVPTKGTNGHRRGKNGPKQGHDLKTKPGHTRLMSAYLIREARAHNLPSLEAPARGMRIDRIRAFP